VQEAAQQATASFQQRAAVVAGVVAGPTLVFGLAGANVDFWPLVSHRSLTKGWLLALIAIAFGISAGVWWWLRPPRGAGG
jgi:Mg2+ and Co2+ transporter CorA